MATRRAVVLAGLTKDLETNQSVYDSPRQRGRRPEESRIRDRIDAMSMMPANSHEGRIIWTALHQVVGRRRATGHRAGQ